MNSLAYFLTKTPPKSTALLKAEFADFAVQEILGYDLSGDGEFVAVQVRKTDCNTQFVAEKLAKFAGIAAKHCGYAGLKDRHAVTEQWFCLHMPGKPTPDFSHFQADGIDILQVTRHHRKIRIGSLWGNRFNLLLRHAVPNDDLIERLNLLPQKGFPNYFMTQRFGHDGENLTQATRWAAGEIQVKDRKKRSFYLSTARSEIFNRLVSARIEQGLAEQVLPQDLVQLAGSHSRFSAAEAELDALQTRLNQRDIWLTAPLIGENNPPASAFEQAWLQQSLLQQYKGFDVLMAQARMQADRRPILALPQELTWNFAAEGLHLSFSLPAGCYATALVRELVVVKETNHENFNQQ